ncbi:MAG: hypothetical protein ACE5JX_07810 [Acidobacteriota bacterium]
MSLNADLIRARCGEIEQSVQRLEEFQDVPVEELLSNQDWLDIASYRLLVAIEAALALCFHVAAKKILPCLKLRLRPSRNGVAQEKMDFFSFF